MLNVEWTSEQALFAEMQDTFNSLEPDSFYMSHYELERKTEYTAADWKTFLTIPAVADYVTQELRMLQQTEMRKLLKDISSNSRSVGTAQMLTALNKMLETTNTKEGPVFIYTYVPPNIKESNSGNVRILKKDPFRKEE